MVWRRRNVTACLIADDMATRGIETVTLQEIKTAQRHIGSTGDTSARSYLDKLKAMGFVDMDNKLLPIEYDHLHIVLPACFSKEVLAKIKEITESFEELRTIFKEE